ncbi:hypothetical protein LCGC14_0540210 [marine sediment metagenome]|uniref:Uncharacterized protein n=1 Tax=marine sediment metagenome TaxID=412755 RepID=A0A0F9RXQ5_9ZZZZ
MKEISQEQETNFKEIFGAEKYNKWVEKYSIFKNTDIQSWIRDKIDKFTQEGKDPVKFGFTSYIGYLQQYCDFNETDNPSKLLAEDIDGRNARLRKYLTFLYNADEEEIKKLDFNRRPSDVSIRNMIQSRIKSFFSNRGVNISYGMKARKSGANKNEITLEKDDIKQIQSKLESAQYRLINKFETQTGLRISDVLVELTSGKYKIEKYKKHYFIKDFISQKEMVTINFLFFTTELSDLLGSIYPKDKMEEIELTKLFLSRKKLIRDENKKVIGEKPSRTIRDVDYLARVKAISKELGFNGNLKTHSFRKYFVDTIDNMEKKEDKFNQHLEGREPSYRDAVYIRSLKSIQKYYTKWLRIEKEVCVDCIIVDNTNKKIVELETEIETLKDQKNISIKQNAELTQRFNKLEEQMKEILDGLKNKD